jgi:hypothetical protein
MGRISTPSRWQSGRTGDFGSHVSRLGVPLFNNLMRMLPTVGTEYKQILLVDTFVRKGCPSRIDRELTGHRQVRMRVICIEGGCFSCKLKLKLQDRYSFKEINVH